MRFKDLRFVKYFVKITVTLFVRSLLVGLLILNWIDLIVGLSLTKTSIPVSDKL